MPDWLLEDALSGSLAWDAIGWRLCFAALFGLVVAGVHAVSQRLGQSDSVNDRALPLFTTLVLLTVLVAMTTMVIGNSVARAFGLVGALSIVRFRTVVEDTRDTAFVIFAVVVGMAIGTGLLLVAVAGVPIVGLAAVALSASARGSPGAAELLGEGGKLLTVRLGAGQPSAAVESLLSMRTRAWRLAGVSTARQGVSMDLSYTVLLQDDRSAPALVAELNAMTGVQGVDLQSALDRARER